MRKRRVFFSSIPSSAQVPPITFSFLDVPEKKGLSEEAASLASLCWVRRSSPLPDPDGSEHPVCVTVAGEVCGQPSN